MALDTEKVACLTAVAEVAKLNGDPTPREFEVLLDAVQVFKPFPHGITLEGLLSHSTQLTEVLPQIQSPERREQVYRAACAIARIQGLDPEEVQLLHQIQVAFELSPEAARALSRQSLQLVQATVPSSALEGIAALMRREGEGRNLILDYALGAAILGMLPLRGGGMLELKLLVVLALILRMIVDVRRLWGRPRGQDILAIAGNFLGGIGAVILGLLTWGTMFGLGIIFPYVGAFAQAVGFFTATWVIGQSTQQFYTSLIRPDPSALKRAFPGLWSKGA